MKLNEKLISLRNKVGLTQKELGDIMLVHKNQISSWEREKRVPCYNNRKKLAKVFNINIKLLEDMNDNEEIIIQLEELFNLSITNKQAYDIERILDERESNNDIKAREIAELLGVESNKIGRIKTLIKEYIGE